MLGINGELNESMALFDEAIARGLTSDVTLWNSMLCVLASMRNTKSSLRALEIFADMLKRKITADHTTIVAVMGNKFKRRQREKCIFD